MRAQKCRRARRSYRHVCRDRIGRCPASNVAVVLREEGHGREVGRPRQYARGAVTCPVPVRRPRSGAALRERGLARVDPIEFSRLARMRGQDVEGIALRPDTGRFQRHDEAVDDDLATRRRLIRHVREQQLRLRAEGGRKDHRDERSPHLEADRVESDDVHTGARRCVGAHRDQIAEEARTREKNLLVDPVGLNVER